MWLTGPAIQHIVLGSPPVRRSNSSRRWLSSASLAFQSDQLRANSATLPTPGMAAAHRASRAERSLRSPRARCRLLGLMFFHPLPPERISLRRLVRALCASDPKKGVPSAKKPCILRHLCSSPGVYSRGGGGGGSAIQPRRALIALPRCRPRVGQASLPSWTLAARPRILAQLAEAELGRCGAGSEAYSPAAGLEEKPNGDPDNPTVYRRIDGTGLQRGTQGDEGSVPALCTSSTREIA